MQDEVNGDHFPVARQVRLAPPLSRYPTSQLYTATLLYMVPDSLPTTPFSKSSSGPQSTTIDIYTFIK